MVAKIEQDNGFHAKKWTLFEIICCICEYLRDQPLHQNFPEIWIGWLDLNEVAYQIQILRLMIFNLGVTWKP